jgi:hypothetical protein
MLDTDEDLETFPGFAGSAVRLLNEARSAAEPVSIRINDRVTLAVGDDESLRMLMALVDRLETLQSIRQGLKEIDEGKGLNLEEVKERFRTKYGTSL